jgi:hypothetical protein
MLKRLLIFVVLLAAVVHADGPDLKITPIQRDGKLVVSFELSEGLTPEVRDAIQSGLPTTFSYEIDLRLRSSLMDRTVASVSMSATVRFDNLTRRYQMSRAIDGRIEDTKSTEDQAAVRQWMTAFERIPIASTAALEPNGEYYVRVRAVSRQRNSWFAWPWDHGAILGSARFTFIP